MHWLEKKAQGRALGLPLRGSPIFVARISPPREMIKHGRRGDKMASKAKRRGPITGSPPNGTGSPGSPPCPGLHSSLMKLGPERGHYDWQSYPRLRSLYRFRNHLFRTARNCGSVRRKLEHGRRDYQRPLRRTPYRRWNKPWPNLFYWRKLFRNRFRSLPDSIGRARFRLRAGPDECSGWPAQRPGDRKVQSVSGQRDVGGYWALRRLLWHLECQSFLTLGGWRMRSTSRCKQCAQPLVEIDHWGERLIGCPRCNRWQASTGEWCRLAPDDISALP